MAISAHSSSNQKLESAVMAEEALKVLDSSLSQIKWRLKPSSKRRLQIGITSLSLNDRYF